MKKVLVVDDQPDIRKLIALTLMRHYQIVEAVDAEQCCSKRPMR